VGFTVLAALTHAHSTGVDGIRETEALGDIDPETAQSLAEFTARGLTGTGAIGKMEGAYEAGKLPL
jgi:hypothetical protein